MCDCYIVTVTSVNSIRTDAAKGAQVLKKRKVMRVFPFSDIAEPFFFVAQ